MVAKIGTLLKGYLAGYENTRISNEVNKNSETDYYPTLYDYIESGLLKQGPYNAYRMPKAFNLAIVGTKMPNYFEDFYFRVHVSPSFIDLQTVASSQSRDFTVWNAWPTKAALLNDVLVSNSSGIDVTGPEVPYSMYPLQELSYTVTVGVAGPPSINSEVKFDFTNIENPVPIVITGTRAIKFDIVPETPLTETWEWLTDNLIATDGSEQRISLRGEIPRIETNLKIIFDDVVDIRNFYTSLMTAVGRLWLPEFQYVTRIRQASTSGQSVVYFDSSDTDIRDGDYVLIKTPVDSQLVEILQVFETYASTSSPLTFNVPEFSMIMPGSPALVSNQTALARYATNGVAEVTLIATMLRQRTSMIRPDSTTEFPYFLDILVMEKRPLADDKVTDAFSTGQITIDNKTGLPDLISRWDYTRVGGQRSFKVNRMKAPEEMDYWKAFFSNARGQSRRFWMPTYRTDLQIATTPSESASALLIEGVEYADKTFGIVTHRYIEIETAGGTHRTEVTGASVSGSNSIISLATVIPAGVDYTNIFRISYLLPVRLNGDSIEWKHYGLESILTFSIITAEV